MKSVRIDTEKGMINRGCWYRLKECMKKARAGEALTTVFLGGSITQGSLSSSPETCYAYLVYDWWRKKFPQAQITFVNAGIGGTTSQFGVSRVEEHVLSHQPDFVLIEFAVNDDNTEFFRETYEGLVRRVFGSETAPAVLLMNNVRYDDGSNAEDMHLEIAKAYGIPMVSMKSTIWPPVREGRIERRDITPDDLHPNDLGHSLVAEVITAFLEKVYETMDQQEDSLYQENLPQPVTDNAYQGSVRYQNYNCQPLLAGFEADLKPQNGILDIFSRGWTAAHIGDRITFTLSGTEIAVQYRKSVHKPVPVAKAVIDGREDEAIVLDGNFQEDWGDCLYIETLAKHMASGEHTVEIIITEAHEDDAVPFYLVSVINS